MKKILLILTLGALSVFTKAQDQKGIIQGALVDSVTSKSIPYATVSVYKAIDTTLITYRLSDEKGNFRVPLLPLGIKLRLMITFTGYAIYRKEFILSANQTQLDLGKIQMQTSSVNLDEVIVRAERPPVMVRKDTIEFNAASFKTLPDALVEDLLRKLPGVNVDKDGNIMVNGRRVSTIYVDGKEFFGGDVRIASKNLPANIIDKVQVNNDPEALKINPFMPESEIPQVVNLKLKPGIKKGIFGKMYAGGGIKDKGETGALLNLFRDTTQVSLLGYANNLNRSAFSFADIRSVGGFGRSGWGNANGNGNGGLSIDRVSFGGYGSGLMKSSGGGVNFNTIFNKKVPFSFNYFYGALSSDYDELRNTQQNYKDTLLNTRQNMRQEGHNYGHLIGTKVTFDLSPKYRVEIRPQLTLSKDNLDQFLDINSISNAKGLLNQSYNDQLNRNKGLFYIQLIRLSTTFKKKGRSMDFYNYTNVDNTNANLFNIIRSTFYNPSSKSTVDQLRKSNINNFTTNFFLRYTDLINENLTWSASATANYFRNQNNLNTYSPDVNDEYIIPVQNLSEDFIRTGFRGDATMGLRWKVKKITVGPGAIISSYSAKNMFSSSMPINQNFFFVLPTLDVNYSIFNLSYVRNFREPAISNLQPVVNNTNALFVRKGNPDLKPAISDYFSLGARKYDTKHLMTYNINFSGTKTKDATVISRSVDGLGVQTTYPVNSDGIWNIGNTMSFQKDWKMADNRQVSFIVSNNSSLSHSVVLFNQVKSSFETINIRPAGEIRVNLNDKFELSQYYAFSYYRSDYESTQFTNQSLIYHDSRSELIFRFSQKFVLESNLDYRYNSNSIPGLLKDYYRWNAAFTYIFLKGNRGQLKFAVNDILDQNIMASRTIRENLIEDMQGSTLRRYGLVTFTYNIRNFGEKIGGRNQLFRF